MGDLRLLQAREAVLDELALWGDFRTAAARAIRQSPEWNEAAEQSRLGASDRVLKNLLRRPLVRR
jgi:hypothetical protein